MIKIIIQLLLNASPVILAAIFHMLVVKKNWFSKLRYPLDHFNTFRGKRIFGNNKTYRGVLIMVVASIVFSYLYYNCMNTCDSLLQYNLLDINTHSFVFYGFIFGIGYIVGELPNSFYKRQHNVASGKADTVLMHIIDQVDSVFTVMFFLVVFSSFSWFHFVIGLFFYGFIHLGINYLLFLFGLRKEAF